MSRRPYWQPIEVGSAVGSTCLNCPPRPGLLRYRDDPSPGFGMVTLRRNGEFVDGTCESAGALVRRWRRAASAAPDNEWTIEVESPMTGVRYTRQTNGRWLATHRSMGFA